MKTKITEYLELTDKRHPTWPELRQVRLVKRLPHRDWIVEGTLGGWVISEDNLEGGAWIGNEVLIISEHARVKDQAVVTGKVKLWGHAQVLGNVYVCGSSEEYSSLKVNAIVRGHADLLGRFDVQGDVVVEGRAYIRGDGPNGLYINGSRIRIGGNSGIRGDGIIGNDCVIQGGEFRGNLRLFEANLADSQHLLKVGPLGSENQMAELYRSGMGENGEHVLTIGCWTGTVYDLADEVEERSHNWNADLETKNLWLRKYKLLGKMCEMTIEGWK